MRRASSSFHVPLSPLEVTANTTVAELAGLDTRPGVVADLGAGPAHVARHLRAAGVPKGIRMTVILIVAGSLPSNAMIGV
jgi:hypothetical protein